MGLDLSRRRFIIGAFASVAGVAAAGAVQAAVFIPKPTLEWEPMLEFLRKSLPECTIIDRSRLSHIVGLEWARPHMGPGPKMLVGWDAMDWNKLTAPQQQESIEFIDKTMSSMIADRKRDAIIGREEALIRDNELGLWCHADT